MTMIDHIRVFWRAAVCGFHEYAVMFTLQSWLFGWFLRVLAQVVFFALIGRLLGSQQQTHFLLVGNAVVIAAIQALGAVASTTWERQFGTLHLLIAAPSSLLTALIGRSMYWAAAGLVSSFGSLLIVGAIFGLPLPWPRVILVVPLISIVALSTYMFATFLGALVLRAIDARNLVANVSSITLMAIAGVNVPVDFFPVPVQWLAAGLPVTHGLYAIRQLLGGAPIPVLVPHIAAEIGIAVAWLVAALIALRRFAEAGRRDGSIEFAA